MKRILFGLALFAVSLVSGCMESGYGWCKADACKDQIKQDCKECKKEAKIIKHATTFEEIMEADLSGDYTLMYEKDDYNMAGFGHMTFGSGDSYIDSCMKAKGYSWRLLDD